MEAKAELARLTDILLNEKATYADIRTAAYSLKDLFSSAAGFQEQNRDHQQHLKLPSGLAVSPYAAAYCIIDMMRTRKFLMGIKEAIDERLKLNASRPVMVLYAGCGPFATLLTPLTTVFSPAQLQMVLLEINPLNMGYLQKIVQHFYLKEYIAGTELADATEYSIPEKFQPDILLSETMKAALQKEPQVNIVASLLPQCNNDPALIPQCIKIDFCKLGKWEDYQHTVHAIATLLELNKETILQIAGTKKGPAVFEEGLQVMLARDNETTGPHFALSTFIQVYGNHTLNLQESDLTLLHRLKEKTENKNETWLFRYNRSDLPGFYITRKEN